MLVSSFFNLIVYINKLLMYFCQINGSFFFGCTYITGDIQVVIIVFDFAHGYTT